VTDMYIDHHVAIDTDLYIPSQVRLWTVGLVTSMTKQSKLAILFQNCSYAIVTVRCSVQGTTHPISMMQIILADIKQFCTLVLETYEFCTVDKNASFPSML